jgi:chromosome segregation ATPase
MAERKNQLEEEAEDYKRAAGIAATSISELKQQIEAHRSTAEARSDTISKLEEEAEDYKRAAEDAAESAATTITRLMEKAEDHTKNSAVIEARDLALHRLEADIASCKQEAAAVKSKLFNSNLENSQLQSARATKDAIHQIYMRTTDKEISELKAQLEVQKSRLMAERTNELEAQKGQFMAEITNELEAQKSRLMAERTSELDAQVEHFHRIHEMNECTVRDYKERLTILGQARYEFIKRASAALYTAEPGDLEERFIGGAEAVSEVSVQDLQSMMATGMQLAAAVEDMSAGQYVSLTAKPHFTNTICRRALAQGKQYAMGVAARQRKELMSLQHRYNSTVGLADSVRPGLLGLKIYID